MARMVKIAYNACYGGFGLSRIACVRYAEIAGHDWERDHDGAMRSDPVLIRVIEELGTVANGAHASLHIRELPAGTKYLISEYDGNERVVTLAEHDWQIAR